MLAQIIQLSYAFSVFLPETRDIMANVNFNKYPELDLFSEQTVQDNIFNKIIFKLNRQEILQTLAVQTEATYDELAEKRKITKEDLEDMETQAPKLEYVSEIDSAYWTRQTRIKFGGGVLCLWISFFLLVFAYIAWPSIDYNID